MFSDQDLAVMDSIIKRYPRSRSAIMPLLHYVQSKAGYVTNEGIELIAQLLTIETAEVSAVATFYTQYKRKPVGEYHVGVCTNTTVQSSKDLVDSMRQGNPTPPTRGPKSLPTWKENSAVLAGINDGRANEGVQAGEPTLLGLKLAKEGK
ncbi:MAG: NADH dehydrogenase subunit E [Actinobacteria bacterium]|nr:NADH dehydrogenase subunit E [Actinomycetota bacterium]